MGELNKSLLAEELKKYRLLSEYSFYVGEDEETPVAPSTKKAKELILSEDPENDDPNQDLDANPDAGLEGDDAELDAPADMTGGAPGPEVPAAPVAPEMPATPPAPAAPPMQPQGNEIELDVTELVQGTEEAKNMARTANEKMTELLSKFNELGQSLSKMDNISKKIEDLEVEIEKRNPTPEEKLEMRSLDSFPYNLKLTDFWADKKGTYDVLNNEDNTESDEDEEKEYVLTHDDANSEYSQGQVKNSFDNVSDDENEDSRSFRRFF